MKTLCTEFCDIFYIDGDNLINEINTFNRYQPTNGKPILTKSYRYPYVYREEVKS